MLQFDKETASRLRKMYEAPYAAERRRRIRGCSALSLARRFWTSAADLAMSPAIAAEVGPSGSVTGVDSSATMLALAAARAEELSLQDRTRFLEGDAAQLPVSENTFDGAVISQVYEYVADLPRALASLRQALKPNGRAIIFDTDWGSVVWHSSDADRMRRVLQAWEEHLAEPDLPRTLGTQLEAAGFAMESAAAVPMFDCPWVESGLRSLAELVRSYVPTPGRRQQQR